VQLSLQWRCTVHLHSANAKAQLPGGQYVSLSISAARIPVTARCRITRSSSHARRLCRPARRVGFFRASLVASADLPEILDTRQRAPALAALGLSEQDLHALLSAVTGDPDSAGSTQ